MDYSLAELLSFARCAAGGDADRAEGLHPISTLVVLARRALNGSDADVAVSVRDEPGSDVEVRPPSRGSTNASFHSVLGGELQNELRLIEEETHIAPDPAAPIVGYVRAVAAMGNEGRNDCARG